MKAIIGILCTLVAVATATVIPANGYTPPSDMPDGAYFVNFDEAGNAVTTRADTGDIVAREIVATSSVEQRDLPTTPFDCGEGCPSSCTGYDLNAGDYATVQHCMDNFLDRTQANGGYGNGVWYCRAGDTLLAVCNYVNTNYGGTSEINTFNSIMDSQCGSYRSGWVFIKAWQKTYVSVKSKNAIRVSSFNDYNSGEQIGARTSAETLEGLTSVTM